MTHEQVHDLRHQGEGLTIEFKECRYCRVYADGAEPQLIEGDVFKTIVPLSPSVAVQVAEQANRVGTPHVASHATPHVTPHAEESDRVKVILEFCRSPRSRPEIQEHLGIKDRKYFRRQILHPLLEKGLLAPTIPDKPKSPKQKYVTTDMFNE